MKKNRIIQSSLLITGIILLFFTYYSKDNDKIADLDKNILIEHSDSLKETTNIIENAIYVGTDNRGTFFELKANIAKVFADEPDLSNMEIVNAVISLRDGRKIYIKSDYATFDKSTNNTNFVGNIFVTESSNKITCDNLDLLMSENLIKVFNNVIYDGEKGIIKSDEVHIDIIKNEANIFMFKKNDKVRVKYKN